MKLSQAKARLSRLKEQAATASGWQRRELTEQVKDLAKQIAAVEYRQKVATFNGDMAGAY